MAVRRSNGDEAFARLEFGVVGEVEAELVDVEAQAAILVADVDVDGVDAEVGGRRRSGSGAGGHRRDYTAGNGREEKDNAEAQRSIRCHFVTIAFGVGCESMPLHFRIISLLIITGTLTLAGASFSSPDQGRLIATAEITSQKYCPAGDERFKVVLTSRLKFENHTSRALILDKQVGKSPDERIIAKNKESLALRDYEDDPIFDSFGSEDPPHFKPSIHLLRSNFVILEPGEAFDSGATIELFVWYTHEPGRKGMIDYGSHALQMGFVGWRYSAAASKFSDAWRKFGELVTEEIYTEPIDFQIPRNPKIEVKCN
jgi:hypothetical protein